MKQAITIEIDTDALMDASDERLAVLWHVTQANPAGIDDRNAGETAEHVGREIIRRWLGNVPPELWRHQGLHHYWSVLQRHGQWNDLEWTPTLQSPEPQRQQDPGAQGGQLSNALRYSVMYREVGQ